MTNSDADNATAKMPFFPMRRGCPFGVPAEYDRLRTKAPVSKVQLANDRTAWLLTRYDDVRLALTDRRFSSNRRLPGFPYFVGGPNPILRRPPNMLGMDPPEHTVLRRAVIPEFTMKRIVLLRSRIQQIVDQCIDTMLAAERPVDLAKMLAVPVPSLVICELLGVPYADHDYCQTRTRRALDRASTPQERIAAFDELGSYFDRLLVDKESNPGDDLLGRQIRMQREEHGTVDHHSLVVLALLLLTAGDETTASTISLSVLALLDNPEQLAVITGDPSKIPLAVEEMLRYFSVADLMMCRVATEDVEIGGVRIAAGDGVIASTLAANRDESVFSNPDEVRVDRDEGKQLAFGYGPHQCLGQHLARLELQIVFDTLLRRIPTLRLAADTRDIAIRDDVNIFGLDQLLVTW